MFVLFVLVILFDIMLSFNVWFNVIVLVVVGIGIVYIFYFKFIVDIGLVKVIIVVYFVFLFGIIWGIIFLCEYLLL